MRDAVSFSKRCGSLQEGFVLESRDRCFESKTMIEVGEAKQSHGLIDKREHKLSPRSIASRSSLPTARTRLQDIEI